MDDAIQFDEDQRVHLLPPEQRERAEALVSAGRDYKEALDKFNSVSAGIIAKIDALASEAEAKRKQVLSLHCAISSAPTELEHISSVCAMRLALKTAELEAARLEVESASAYKAALTSSRVLLTEIFGGR